MRLFLQSPIIGVCVVEPTEPFISFVDGFTTIEALQAIEKDIKDNPGAHEWPRNASIVYYTAEWTPAESCSQTPGYFNLVPIPEKTQLIVDEPIEAFGWDVL